MKLEVCNIFCFIYSEAKPLMYSKLTCYVNPSTIHEDEMFCQESPLFSSLTTYTCEQQTSATDTPPRSCAAYDTAASPEKMVASSDDSATVNSAATLPALLSPSTSQKQSLSLNLFINKGLLCDKMFMS